MAEVKTGPGSLSGHLSGLRLSPESDGNPEEKSIYENLMEIFPLMEDFMKNQGRSSFAHQAPMSFTRAPSRQVPQKRKLGEQKPVWPSNGKAPSNGSGGELKPLNILLEQDRVQDLRQDVEQLSNRLRDTQLQSNAATKELQSTLESKETRIVEMELAVRRLQKEVQRREQVANTAQEELADSQNEIARMRSVMLKAGSNMSKNNYKSAEVEKELLDLQLQLSELYSQVDSNDEILSESLQSVFPTKNVGPVGKSRNDRMEWHSQHSEKMELARRAYLAAVIVARVTEQESPLTLCAVLRFQLQAFLRQTDFFVDSQVAGLAFTKTHLDLIAS